MSKNRNLSGGLFSSTKAPLTIKETPLSAMIAEYLSARRIYNDRLNSGKVQVIKTYPSKSGEWREYRNWMHLCEEGTPDRFAIVRGDNGFGVHVYIEVKQKGKKASPEQISKHEELRRAGAVVITVDSFDDFLAKFEEAQIRIKAALKVRAII